MRYINGLFALSIGLGVAASPDVYGQTRRFCGGLIGASCPEGYFCDRTGLPPCCDIAYPCKKIVGGQLCGGLAGLPCPAGYRCKVNAPPGSADFPGKCVKDGASGKKCKKDRDCRRGYGCVWALRGDRRGSVVFKECRKALGRHCMASHPCPRGYRCEANRCTKITQSSGGCGGVARSRRLECGGKDKKTCPRGYSCKLRYRCLDSIGDCKR